MKTIIFSLLVFLFCCFSLGSSNKLETAAAKRALVTPHKAVTLVGGETTKANFNTSGVSMACVTAMIQFGTTSAFYAAQLAYTATCSQYANTTVKNSILHAIGSSSTDLDIDIDCTKSANAPYSDFQTQCDDLDGKWCTASVKLDFDDIYDFELELKMYTCLPPNCTRSDVSALDDDLNSSCDKAITGDSAISDVSCSVDLSCGSSAVIIIIIIIVIIVVLVVIAVVVVMIMRKRRAEYTPIKTGEYH